MKVSREQVAENRKRILKSASNLFREKGFESVGVDAVMKAAGMTHGAFYGYFSSKQELIGEACAHGLAGADNSWTAASDPLSALAGLYLAADHCADVGDGCLFPALGSEVVRQSPDARRVLTDALRARVDTLTGLLPGSSPAAKREQAIATWAGLIGALVLARVVDDPALRREILTAGKAVFGASRRGKPKKKLQRP